MTGSQSRLVAVQAVVVGVLLVIVFVTLLQPESESPIEGVQGPQGAQNGGEQQGPVYTGAGSQGGGPGASGGGPGGNGGAGPGGGGGAGLPGGGGGGGVPGTPELGLTGPSTGPAGGGTTGGTGDLGNPSGDQYTDALSRLILSVN